MELIIKNFAGAKSVSVNLENKMTCLTGLNHSGKTSTLRALRTVLLNRKMPEDQPQKESYKLRHHGECDATLELLQPGVKYVWTYTKKGVTAPVSNQPWISEYAARTKRLTEMSVKERADELIDLLRANPTKDDWNAACEEAFILPDVSSGVWGQIARVGWKAVEADYQQSGAYLKRRYQEVTGETWGTGKGGQWQPEGYKYADHSTELTKLNAERDELLKQQGMSSVKKERLTELRAKRLEESITVIQEKILAVELDLGTATALLKSLESQSASRVQECPHCAGALIVDANENIQAAAANPAGKTGPEHVRAIEAQSLRVNSLKKIKQNDENVIVGLQIELAEQKTLEKEFATLGAGVSNQDAIIAVDKEIAALQHQVLLRQKITEAKEINDELRANLAIQELVKPTGVRQKKLAKALERFSEEASQFLKWRPIRIQPDMSIEYEISEGHWRGLDDISGGERFMVDTMLQLAIAHMLNDKWVLIDEATLLDKPTRSQLFELLASSDIKSIVALHAHTPEVVPNLANMGLGQTIWFEDGVGTAVQREKVAK